MAIGLLGATICVQPSAATDIAIEEKAILRRFPDDNRPFYGVEATTRRHGRVIRIALAIRDIAGPCQKESGRGQTCSCARYRAQGRSVLR